MTGPEHYREAERLLAIPVSTDADDQGAVIALHLAAQAHATLALAAAQIEQVSARGPGDVDQTWIDAMWRGGVA